MKKRISLTAAALVTALLLGGCAMQTVEQMYCVPKRSQSFDHVQKVMDMAMIGLEYASPVSGENQQTVQLADLDGDGVDEYILFARSASEVPLNVLVFDTDEEGKCYLLEVLEMQGTAFDKVEYVNIDDHPGLELVVGRQLSDQLQGNVSVYSFSSGRAQKLMSTGDIHFLATDLDRNGSYELLVIQSGQSGDMKGLALSYQYRDGEMQRSMEVKLSSPAGSVERIVVGRLMDDEPAVFISSTVDDSAIVTDVLCMQQDRLTNLMRRDSSVMALRNYYVYPTDIDQDQVMEIPQLIPMKPVDNRGIPETRYLILWYALDSQGEETEKFYTFHDYGGGWYLRLDPAWATRISAEKIGNTYSFYLWNTAETRADPLLSLYVFTGSDRDEQAGAEGRFPLLRKEGVAYGAQIYPAGLRYGLTEEYLIDSFHLIYQDWKTGET